MASEALDDDPNIPDDPAQVSDLGQTFEPYPLPTIRAGYEKNLGALRILRQEYKEFASAKMDKIGKTLDKITQKNKKDPRAQNDNLIKILGNKYFLHNCYEKIKSNRGALTPGTDHQTVDEIAERKFENMSKEILSGNFTFGKSRRIYVEKPGKAKLRPITIPNISDRIVQEGIKVILNAIYEPTFEKQGSNFGFRPGRSCGEAMGVIKNGARQMDIAIEGDIEGAYDNVNQEKMIEILSKRITEKKFLKLIKQLHRSGIMEKDIVKETTLGIPQGGTASPILFNIYMHEFDEYVTQKYTRYMEQEQAQRDTIYSGRSPTSRRYRQLERSARVSKQKIDTIFRRTKAKAVSDLKEHPLERQQYIEVKKDIERKKSLKYKFPSQAATRKKPRFLYIRYADDWVFFTNLSAERALEIKKDLGSFLKTELGLTLSEEKTKITNLHKEYAKFLGFRIRNSQNLSPLTTFTANRKIRRTLQVKSIRIKVRKVFKAFIDIDHDRVKWRMRLKGILDQRGRTRRYLLVQQLKEHEIVFKFRQMMEGLFNYYIRHLTYKSNLQQYYYILTFSCLHTLAARKRTTLRKLFMLYGPKITVPYQVEVKDKKGQTKSETHYASLPRYTELMRIAGLRMYRSEEKDKDFLNIKVNLKTSYKFIKYCAICGASPSPGNPIQSHHVRHVRKGKNTDFVRNTMRALNKKQLVCCKTCHNRIHNGTYNGLKLADFFDPDLARI